jgi:hypothetical protein
MIKIISNAGKIVHGIKEFLVDTPDDIKNLP